MGVKLSAASFLVSPPQRRKKTACGGVLALTLLPLLVLLYAFTWFNTWYNGDLGALQETSVQQVQFGTGIKMDGAQELYCIALSGCWYTVYRETEGEQCPPQKTLRTMYQKFTSLLTLFDTGSLGQRRFDLASKRCAYAPYQAKLEGVCVVATPDPIDKLTVTWKVPTSGAAGQGFGVALKTEYMGQVGRTNYREEEATGDTFVDASNSVAGLASRWFGWTTDGGGRGYEVKTAGVELHYGLVELQPLEYSYEHAIPKADALQLVPTYGHTIGTPSVPWNICYEPAWQNAAVLASNSKCQDERSGPRQKECVQLQIGPSTTKVTEKRSIVGPFNAFVGAMGGVFTLLVMVLTTVNGALVALFAKKCWMCEPVEAEEPAATKTTAKV